MRKGLQIGIVAIVFLSLFAVSTYAQRGTTFTGTAVTYGAGFNTRTVTRPFTMIVTGKTSPEEAARYLNTLQQGGQDALMREISSNNLGRFSLSGNVGQALNVVIVDEDNGETRIRAVFQRWVGFGELRRGLRSADYPFGYVEIRVDPRTGRGDGTFIPAARIRMRGNTVEIEDFGTFPGRLMGVQVRGMRLP